MPFDERNIPPNVLGSNKGGIVILELTAIQAIVLQTALENEINQRSRICQEHGLSEHALNIEDFREMLEKVKSFNSK